MMEAFFVGVCFSDLNVVAQESKRTNEAMLQALANCMVFSLDNVLGYNHESENYLFYGHIYLDGYDCVALNKEVVLAKKVQVNCHLSIVCIKSKAV